MLIKKGGFLLLLLLLVMSLAACSDEEGEGAAEDGEFGGELTVWVHPYVASDLKADQEKVFADMAASFNEQYPGVEVNFEEIPWANREQKLLTALAANQGPDVFYLIPDMMAQFAETGVLEPITDYIGDDWGQDDYADTTLEAVTYQGDLYGLPILREVTTQIYNKNILEEVGGDPENPPTTWEEFNALAEKAVDAGYYGRSFEGANTPNATIYPLIWQAGGDILSEDGEVLINSEKFVKAFELVNEWYKNGVIPPDSINTLSHFEAFLEGNIFSVFGTGLTFSSMEDRGFTDYVVGPPLMEEEQATFGTTGMFVVASNSDNKEAASLLVKEMTNEEHTKAFNTLTKYIPPRASGASIFEGNADMMQLTEYLDVTKPGVMHPVARNIIPLVQAEMQAMMEGTKTPQEAADAAAAAIQSEIDRM
ncbi:sugar ABC transporter substrate-binding protein [Jeotgalibacillus soli]|uniref:ABC transporter substrate-binding protein n=1 Tax=Jeotgalibacillus soli TaxID=889306 RepID=A0A0C2VLP5_9BACL|nr:sugar ABC transporter substrate-binding protein [Jeotgalibacillus soli]KIL49847.1 hypothetical protein KP78_13150 [Jeotgalibacillus soli]